MSWLVAIAVLSLAWALFGLVSGLIGAQIPPGRLRRDLGPLRLRPFEAGGSWYCRRLRIQRWKDRLPEAGGLFGGVSKKSLASRRPEMLERFAVETRRAEWVHWANIAFGATFVLWTDVRIGAFMFLFGVVVHLPFIVVQRYNRARVMRIQGIPVPARTRRSTSGRVVIAAVVLSTVAVGAWAVLLRPDPARVVTVSQALDRLASSPGAGSAGDSAGLPAEGVYRYRGEGTEGLDFPSVSQRQGPDVPGTVTHNGDRCWDFRVDYTSKHAQTWNYCREGDDLVEVGGHSDQRLNIGVTDITIASTTVCEPGALLQSFDDPTGLGTVEQHCSATTSANDQKVHIEGTAVFVGVESLRVDDRTVKTCHYRHDRTMSGGQTGSEQLDLWLDCESGLPIRNTHRVQARAGTPIGDVTYTEKGSFTLQHLAPDTSH